MVNSRLSTKKLSFLDNVKQNFLAVFKELSYWSINLQVFERDVDEQNIMSKKIKSQSN